MGMWRLVAARLRLPSTWLGAAVIAAAMGVDPERAQHLAEAVALVLGGGMLATVQAERAVEGGAAAPQVEPPASEAKPKRRRRAKAADASAGE